MEEIHYPGLQKCLIEEDAQCITLARLIVQEDQRGKGVGSAVLDLLRQRARKAGKTLRLTVDPQVDPTSHLNLVRYYKRRGFQLMSDGETMICRP